MREAAGRAAAPAAKWRNCLRWGGFMMRLSIKFADEISRIGPQHYTDFGCSRKVRGGLAAAYGPSVHLLPAAIIPQSDKHRMCHPAGLFDHFVRADPNPRANSVVNSE